MVSWLHETFSICFHCYVTYSFYSMMIVTFFVTDYDSRLSWLTSILNTYTISKPSQQAAIPVFCHKHNHINAYLVQTTDDWLWLVNCERVRNGANSESMSLNLEIILQETDVSELVLCDRPTNQPTNPLTHPYPSLLFILSIVQSNKFKNCQWRYGLNSVIAIK